MIVLLVMAFSSSNADRLQDAVDIDKPDQSGSSTYTDPATNSACDLSIDRQRRLHCRRRGISAMSPISSTTMAVAHVLVLDDDRRRGSPLGHRRLDPSRISLATSVTDMISPRMFTTPWMKSGTHGTEVIDILLVDLAHILDPDRVPLLVEPEEEDTHDVAGPPRRLVSRASDSARCLEDLDRPSSQERRRANARSPLSRMAHRSLAQFDRGHEVRRHRAGRPDRCPSDTRRSSCGERLCIAGGAIQAAIGHGHHILDLDRRRAPRAGPCALTDDHRGVERVLLGLADRGGSACRARESPNPAGSPCRRPRRPRRDLGERRRSAGSPEPRRSARRSAARPGGTRRSCPPSPRGDPTSRPRPGRAREPATGRPRRSRDLHRSLPRPIRSLWGNRLPSLPSAPLVQPRHLLQQRSLPQGRRPRPSPRPGQAPAPSPPSSQPACQQTSASSSPPACGHPWQKTRAQPRNGLLPSRILLRVSCQPSSCGADHSENRRTRLSSSGLTAPCLDLGKTRGDHRTHAGGLGCGGYLALDSHHGRSWLEPTR